MTTQTLVHGSEAEPLEHKPIGRLYYLHHPQEENMTTQNLVHGSDAGR